MESAANLFLRVNGENTPSDCLFDAWREITSPLYDTTARDRAASYRADVTACLAGEVFVSRVRYDPMVCRRGHTHLTHGDLDYFVLQLFVAGSERLFAGDSQYLLGPSTVCLRDWRYGFTGVSARNDIIGYAIPRHLLHTCGRINSQNPVILWPAESAPGRLLAKSMMRAWQRLPNASQREAATLASGMVSLVNGILTNRLMGQSEELRINHAMQLTVKQYIADHLDDPGLDVALLCHRFRLSRASLYRLFREEGGVQGYIRAQRLKRCFNMLSAASPARLKVREVAERWGFDNASHFHRLFKANFGMAPSELLVPLDSDASSESIGKIRGVRTMRSWAQGG